MFLMEDISEQRLKLVAPALSVRVRKMAEILSLENIPLRVTQGFRSWADQQKLWLQGRDADGNVIDKKLVVTNAPPGHSWHEFGLAVDVVPMTLPQGQPDWNVAHLVWKRIVEIGESLGLFSGTEFHSCPADTPHFQFTGNFPVSPDDEVRQIFKIAGVLTVWEQAQLPPFVEAPVVQDAPQSESADEQA